MDKSVIFDVNFIRFEFKASLDIFGWIRGNINIDDLEINQNSPFMETLTLILSTGGFEIDISSLET